MNSLNPEIFTVKKLNEFLKTLNECNRVVFYVEEGQRIIKVRFRNVSFEDDYIPLLSFNFDCYGKEPSIAYDDFIAIITPHINKLLTVNNFLGGSERVFGTMKHLYKRWKLDRCLKVEETLNFYFTPYTLSFDGVKDNKY